MAPEFLFIRHGESLANLTRTIMNRVTDPAPLTERGRLQAMALLHQLQHRPVKAVYSSPLLRARETAEILGNGFGLQVNLADALREPFCGEIEGRSDEEAWRLHEAQEIAWRAGVCDHHIPGGESFVDLRERFVPFINQLISTYQASEGSILLVSHGSLLRNMLPLVLANIVAEFAHTHPLLNCSYVVCAFKNAGLVCAEWNGNSHQDSKIMS